MAARLNTAETAVVTMAPDVFLEHVGLMRSSKTAADSAVARHRASRKAFEEAGGDLKAYALFEKLAKLEDDERTIRLRRVRQYAAWDGSGEQQDMFAGTDTELGPSPSDAAQQEHAYQGARLEGLEHARLGGDVKDCTYAPGSAQAQAWRRGYDEGQAQASPDGGVKKASTRRQPKRKAAEEAPAADAETPAPKRGRRAKAEAGAEAAVH